MADKSMQSRAKSATRSSRAAPRARATLPAVTPPPTVVLSDESLAAIFKMGGFTLVVPPEAKAAAPEPAAKMAAPKKTAAKKQ